MYSFYVYSVFADVEVIGRRQFTQHVSQRDLLQVIIVSLLHALQPDVMSSGPALHDAQQPRHGHVTGSEAFSQRIQRIYKSQARKPAAGWIKWIIATYR